MTIIFDIVKILRKEDRLKFIYLFFLVLINVFLEMFGIGLIFPILGFLISDAFLIKYSDYLQILSPFFEINRNNLIIFFFYSSSSSFCFEKLNSFIFFIL